MMTKFPAEVHVNDSVQNCNISITNALEKLQSYNKPLLCVTRF